MHHKLLTFLPTLLGTLLVIAAAGSPVHGATLLYMTDFTTADGFTEGGVINGVDGWNAQVQLETVDVAAAGELQFAANFVRGYNANTVFNVADTIEITASVKTIGGNNPVFDANLLHLGLTSSTNLGSLTNQAGILLGGSGADFRIATQSNVGRKNAGTIDTSFHDLTTSITKLATADSFEVTGSFNGESLGTFIVVDSALYNAADVNTVIFSQGQNNVGGIAIDSLSVSIDSATAVPEPSSLVLFGIVGVGAMVRRRKRGVTERNLSAAGA